MMRSNIPVSERRFDLTLFSKFWGTTPTYEVEGATVGLIADLITPVDGPGVREEKERGVFFVPCLLQEAPLVGKTLANAISRGRPAVGKMRSAAHVTVGAWAKIDGDGLTQDQFDTMRATLGNAGIAHLIYSTHSHGRVDRPGIRCRIVVFFDAALAPLVYQRAVLSLSRWLLGQSLDESEALLCQQAGVWTVHPHRLADAFCYRELDGVCVSTEALLAAAPAVQRSATYGAAGVSLGVQPLDEARVSSALGFIDSNDRKAWIDTGIWLRAAYGDVAFSTWSEWSLTADEAHRASESECERAWEGLTPRITSEQGVGALFAAARDGCIEVVRHASDVGQWNGHAKDALVYLRRFHSKTFAQLAGRAAA